MTWIPTPSSSITALENCPTLVRISKYSLRDFVSRCGGVLRFEIIVIAVNGVPHLWRILDRCGCCADSLAIASHPARYKAGCMMRSKPVTIAEVSDMAVDHPSPRAASFVKRGEGPGVEKAEAGLYCHCRNKDSAKHTQEGVEIHTSYS